MPTLVPAWSRIAASRLLDRRAYGLLPLGLLFLSLLVGSYATYRHSEPNTGLSFSRDAASGQWRVVSVVPTSRAAASGIRPGDIVRAIHDRDTSPERFTEAEALNRASYLLLERPGTGQQFALGRPGAISQRPNPAPFIGMAVSFFLVGAVAFLLGRGPAPAALACLCGTGTLLALVIPISESNVLWVLAAFSLGVPLFMSSFAYLFLVFPTPRRRILPGKQLASEWIFLPAVPIIAISLTGLVTPNAPIIAVNRLIGYPYFACCLLVGAGSLLHGWWHATTARIRAQYRTLGIGILAAVVPFLLLTLLPQVGGRRPWLDPELTVLPLILIPAAFGYAILRYQVMDIHLVVRRSLVYSLLGLLLAGIYTTVLVIGAVVVRDHARVNSVVAFAIVTIFMVIAGDNVRHFFQRKVDRFFDREGYDFRQQLREFSHRMNTILDLDELAQSTVDLIQQTMRARHIRLFLYDPDQDAYVLWRSAGPPLDPDQHLLGSLHTTVKALLAAPTGYVQYFEIPSEADSLHLLLRHKGRNIGLMAFGLKRADLPYSSEDVALLRTVCDQLAMATENEQLHSRLRDLYLSGIRTLAATVDAKDSYTHGHSERVGIYARALASALDLPQLEIETIALAGLLHDIGKIGVPDAVLQKPGKLDPDEYELIKQHADLGARILSDNPALAPLVPLVRHHHEAYDGKGYPAGIAGEAIPLGAAIIAVADTYDTMTTDRPYRRAPGHERARAEIVRCGGQQFHPRVVEAFLRASETNLWRSAPDHIQAKPQMEQAAIGRAAKVNGRATHIVYQIAQALGEVAELQPFLVRVVHLLRRELGTEVVEVYLADPETGHLRRQGPGQAELALLPGLGVVGWVAEHRTALRLDDMRDDPRAIVTDGWEGRSQLAAPLISDDRVIGVINVESSRVANFSDDDKMLLAIVAGQLAQVIEVALLHDHLKRIANLDGLTGVANYRHFYERLDAELRQAREQDHPLALVMIDVDGLKGLNDTYGHLAGDAALRTIAAHLHSACHHPELVARYGGDEFAILFPTLDQDAARARAAALVSQLASLGCFALGELVLPLPAVSFGVASTAIDGAEVIALVAAADARMYQQKHGRREGRAQSGAVAVAVSPARGDAPHPAARSAARVHLEEQPIPGIRHHDRL